MSPTITLLTAGLLATQSAAPATSAVTAAPISHVQKKAAVQPEQYAAEPGFFRGLFKKSDPAVEPEPAPPSDRPILSKIQSLFGKKDAERAEPEPINTAEPPLGRPVQTPAMQRMPAGQPTRNNLAIPEPLPPATVKVQPVTFQGVPAGQPAPAPLKASPVAMPTAVQATAPTSTVIPPSRANKISPELAGKVGHETDYSWITGQIRIENGVHVLHYATPETVDTYNGSLPLVSSLDLRSFQDGEFVSVRGQVTGNGRSPSYRLTNIDRLPR